MTIDVVPAIIVPFFVGVVIPFLTNWTTARGWPVWIETLLNIAFSAATSAITTITFDGDWRSYLIAFGVAWVGALRGHYLGFAQALYSDRVTGKHERNQDQV